VISVSEEPQPAATPAAPDTPTGSEISRAEGARLSNIVTSHLADQARQTAKAARARRAANADGEPGVLDMTPLRDLLAELVEELQKVRPRERVARALRQAADIIDPPTSIH
jgi:hypothetical protein